MENDAGKNRYREIKIIKDESIVLLSKNRYQLSYDGSFIYYGLKNVGRVIPSQTANGLTEPILTSLHLARGMINSLLSFKRQKNLIISANTFETYKDDGIVSR